MRRVVAGGAQALQLLALGHHYKCPRLVVLAALCASSSIQNGPNQLLGYRLGAIRAHRPLGAHRLGHTQLARLLLYVAHSASSSSPPVSVKSSSPKIRVASSA